MKADDCLRELQALRERYGYGNFDHALRKLKAQRLQNTAREARVKVKRGTHAILYEAQKGVCPWCKEPLLLPFDRNHVDHRDPNAQRFNHRSNLQLLHPRCNLEKSSKSIGEQSKATGKPFTELIG